jgi:elongator complex protein 3
MMIPEYVRLNRTYRDIPASEILEWSHLSNLRQIVEDKIKSKWIHLTDVRHRELKDKKNDPTKWVLNNFTYEASWWKEYFLTYEDRDDRTIFSLMRLRIPNVTPPVHSSRPPQSRGIEGELYSLIPEIVWASLIREIHTFWDQLNVWEAWSTFWQHIWLWKRLIEEAERLTLENGLKKVAVIAWVWVREYYKKRGYILEWEYMVKYL